MHLYAHGICVYMHMKIHEFICIFYIHISMLDVYFWLVCASVSSAKLNAFYNISLIMESYR